MQIIIKGLILGLSTGGYCSLYCLPVLAPVLISRDNAGYKTVLVSLMQFLAGRLTAYLLFGLIIGLTGGALKGLPIFHPLVIPVVFIILGGLMLGYSFTNRMSHHGLCHVIGKRTEKPGFLFALGFLVGINVCPPFLLAVGVASDTADVFKSILFFLAFFLATSIFLLPLLISGIGSKIALMKKTARILSGVVGGYFIIQGVVRVVSYI